MPQITNLRKIAISLAMFTVVALGSSAVARADTFTYSINTPNAGLAGSPAPYATVTLTQVFVNQGSTVCTASAPCINVSVQMLTNANGGTYQLFGQNDAFGFNGPAGLTLSNFASEDGTGALSGFSAGAGGQMDGFGNFEYTVSGGPASDAHDFLTFTVSGVILPTANRLYEANADGHHFAVHVAPTNGNPTGFATDGTTPPPPPPGVPEPASMLLLGTGLLGLGAGIRRRRKT